MCLYHQHVNYSYKPQIITTSNVRCEREQLLIEIKNSDIYITIHIYVNCCYCKRKTKLFETVINTIHSMYLLVSMYLFSASSLHTFQFVAVSWFLYKLKRFAVDRLNWYFVAWYSICYGILRGIFYSFFSSSKVVFVFSVKFSKMKVLFIAFVGKKKDCFYRICW